MNPEIVPALEAILLVADSPVEVQLLAQLVEQPTDEVEAVLASLAATYAEQGRGFALARVAGGWRYQTVPAMAPYVERFVLEGQTAKLSGAALETLAIVAYKQPISRAQIAAIRGVSVDGVVRTLEQRGYIGEVARDPGPGQAVLFGTTPAFLEKMGLDSLADLPAIAEFVPGADVVEALEHGLRVEAEVQSDLHDGAEDAPTEAVLDVTDTAVVEHVEVAVSEVVEAFEVGADPGAPADADDDPEAADGGSAGEGPAVVEHVEVAVSEVVEAFEVGADPGAPVDADDDPEAADGGSAGEGPAVVEHVEVAVSEVVEAFEVGADPGAPVDADDDPEAADEGGGRGSEG